MSNNLVSIIIPVHNSEDYVERCLNSIYAQTYKDIEIIVVENKSSDNSFELCKKSLENSGKKYILEHSDEAGVSKARNFGVSKAKGDFIMFVDSDDWLAVDCVEKMVNKCLEDQSDLVIAGHYSVQPSGISSNQALPFAERELTNILMNNFPAYCWGKLYTKKIFDKLHFPEGVSLGEDTAVVLPVLSYCEAISFIDEQLYYYFCNENSALNTVFDNPQKMFSYVVAGKIALENSNPDYTKYVAVSIAKRIINNKNWFLKYYCADVVNYVAENMHAYFAENELITNDCKLREIITFKDKQVVPSRAYVANFGNMILTDSQLTCLERMKNCNFLKEIVILNEKNCDIKSSPKSVVELYNSGRFDLVGFYFKLKSIYENGGVGVGLNTYLNKPLGEPRLYESFFGTSNSKTFDSNVFGGIKGADAIKSLLDTFNDDCYKDNNIEIDERIRTVLTCYYGYNNESWFTLLPYNKVAIYGADAFSYFYNKNNVCYEVEDDVVNLVNSKYYFVEKSVIDNETRIRNNQYNKIVQLEGKLKNSISREEAAAYENMKNELNSVLNSTTWKFGKPFRFIGKVLRKIFKHERTSN